MVCKRVVAIVFTAVLTGALAQQQQQPPQQPPPQQPKPQPQPQPQPQPREPSTPSVRGQATPPWESSNLNMQQTVMLTGRLVMPDALPPSDMVPVELECPGKGTARALSDLRGEFRFPLSMAHGPAARHSQSYGCNVVVRVPGFQIATKPLGNSDLSLGADVGILVLKPIQNAEGTLISYNSFSAPEAARKELLKSREDAQKGKLDSAVRRLEKAIGEYPAYATAWYELGRVQERRGERGRAEESYRKAAESDPKYLNPRIQLALLAATSQRWPDAEAQAAHVLKLAPQGLPGVYLVHAIACINQKKTDAAEKSAREGMAQDSAHQFPKLAHILGDTLERKGDAQGAVAAYRQYLEFAPQARDAAAVRERISRLSR